MKSLTKQEHDLQTNKRYQESQEQTEPLQSKERITQILERREQTCESVRLMREAGSENDDNLEIVSKSKL